MRESGKDEDDFLTKTTLTMHFFGSRGTGTITFKQFMKYVIDVEVYQILRIRFLIFSEGHSLNCVMLRAFERLLKNTFSFGVGGVAPSVSPLNPFMIKAFQVCC